MMVNGEAEELGEPPRSLLPKSPTGIKGFDENAGGVREDRLALGGRRRTARKPETDR